MNIKSATSPAKEWLRISEAIAFCGMSKTALFTLMKKGLIRNASLREAGTPRGTRLIHFQSLKGFLEGRADGGSPPAMLGPVPPCPSQTTSF